MLDVVLYVVKSPSSNSKLQAFRRGNGKNCSAVHFTHNVISLQDEFEKIVLVENVLDINTLLMESACCENESNTAMSQNPVKPVFDAGVRKRYVVANHDQSQGNVGIKHHFVCRMCEDEVML